MADSLLKRKAIANYHAGMGWYSGDAGGNIVTSPANTVASKAMQSNPKKKHVMVGRARIRIKGM